jgi:hypothetical protein
MSDRIKFWLLLVLLLSNLTLGAVGLHALRSVERNYTELVSLSIPVVDALRALTRDIGAVQRSSLRLIWVDDQAERQSLLHAIEEVRPMIDRSLKQLTTERSLLSDAERQRIQSEVESYLLAAEAMLRARHLKQDAEASRIHREAMRPSYETAMRAIDDGAALVLHSGNELRARYSSQSDRLAQTIVLLGGWPAALAGACLVFGFAIAVILFFPAGANAASKSS